MVSGQFTRELWEAAAPIYESILSHPFVTELVEGSLQQDRFRFYLIQDALYLSEFARVLNLAAAHAPKDEWVVTFSEHAKAILLGERLLHEDFFKEWGLSEEAVYSKPMSPTNLAYTSYLMATAYSKPFHELLGALLACYWIYWEVGKHLEQRGSRNQQYQRWIETYSSKEYTAICKAVLEITEKVGQQLDSESRLKVRNQFIVTCRYEYMFWDSAYRLERWPI
jgi:thiaminase/transcriptional activator TenA